VHGGKRTKRKAENIETEYYTIQTDNLKAGGEYSVLLTSVTDRMSCKEFLKAQTSFKVRGERPKAYFGLIEGKRATRMLEGKKIQLPLRLTGKPRWKLSYRNLNDPDNIRTEILASSNANLGITSEGRYELLSVQDDVCPGTIDESGKQFSVEWIPRPRVSVHEGPAMKLTSGKYVKDPVCEGDVDSFEVSLTGTLSTRGNT
jgi:nucleoporin POM152